MRVGVVALICLLAVSPVEAATRYVTADGALAANGTDWANACNGFTGACAPSSLTRGDLIYVADGDLRSDGLLTFSKSANGTITIEIRKATVADHGTSTGWVDSMGDGQMVFDRFLFGSPYWILNGQVGVDDGSVTAYGFKVDNQLCTGANNNDTKTAINLGSGNAGMKVLYVEVEQCGEDSRFDGTIEADGSCTSCGLPTDGIRSSNTTTPTSDLQISHVYIHDFTRNGLTIDGIDDVLIEYVWFARLHSPDIAFHGQAIQFTRPAMDNVTIRYCTFIDIAGSGAVSWLYLSAAAGAPYTNHFVYGNLFYTTVSTALGINGRYYYSPGALWLREGNTGGGDNNMDTMLIYNNTYYNVVNPEPWFTNTRSTHTGVEVRNNVYVNSQFLGNPVTTGIASSHNYYYNNTGSFVPVGETSQQDGSADPFTNAAGFDFTLSSGTTAGTTLASPYEIDSTGAARGEDGTWDRGAFEFASGGSTVFSAAGAIATSTLVVGIGEANSSSPASPLGAGRGRRRPQ